MINWDRVNELREEVGAEDFTEVVDIFLEEVEDVLARLQASPASPVGGDDLHFLKGSALNLGFEALSDLCHQAERNVMAGNADADCLARLLDTYATSKSEFLSHEGMLSAAA